MRMSYPPMTLFIGGEPIPEIAPIGIYVEGMARYDAVRNRLEKMEDGELELLAARVDSFSVLKRIGFLCAPYWFGDEDMTLFLAENVLKERTRTARVS